MKVPKTKITIRLIFGVPSEAIHSEVKVGHSSNSEPMGLSIRINFAYSASCISKLPFDFFDYCLIYHRLLHQFAVKVRLRGVDFFDL